MQCTMCGREITNPDANYCDYCGTAVGTVAYSEVRQENQNVSTNAPKEERISTWLFLGVMCLQFVPMIGAMAYVGVLLYWAFAGNITDSRKSFARASLIYTVVALVFGLLVLGAFVGSVVSGLSELL